MNLHKNDFGYKLGLKESEKNPGVSYFEGEIIQLILSQGYTNCSLELSEKYGVSLNFRKPLTKEEKENLRLKKELTKSE